MPHAACAPPGCAATATAGPDVAVGASGHHRPPRLRIFFASSGSASAIAASHDESPREARLVSRDVSRGGPRPSLPLSSTSLRNARASNRSSASRSSSVTPATQRRAAADGEKSSARTPEVPGHPTRSAAHFEPPAPFVSHAAVRLCASAGCSGRKHRRGAVRARRVQRRRAVRVRRRRDPPPVVVPGGEVQHAGPPAIEVVPDPPRVVRVLLAPVHAGPHRVNPESARGRVQVAAA